MNSGARFDRTRQYRYALWRQWDSTLPCVAFIMLNPSQADAVKNDQTISNCIAFAMHLGFGAMEVVNLFAYRTSDPRELRQVLDPVGTNNDRFIRDACKRADRLIVAWGNHGALGDRSGAVKGILAEVDRDKISCFGITMQGHPRHPLYVKRSAPLQQFYLT
ncbi:MAG TPA: DUF1643 domain-containing protein [Planktothrix sp.]